VFCPVVLSYKWESGCEAYFTGQACNRRIGQAQRMLAEKSSFSMSSFREG